MRVFDQYLSLATLPRNPRWRSVVQTANYVLDQCPPEFSKRKELKDKIDNIIQDFQ
jgi:hypothetical protein